MAGASLVAKVHPATRDGNMGVPFIFKSPFESFARDLTAAAIRDELEPVSCREKEIERVITTLLRQSKNNPVLLGEAGVGKTAVVEGLAQRIMAGAVPLALKSARILSLSHLDLIAGTTFRGQYERRLQALINKLQMTQISFYSLTSCIT